MSLNSLTDVDLNNFLKHHQYYSKLISSQQKQQQELNDKLDNIINNYNVQSKSLGDKIDKLKNINSYQFEQFESFRFFYKYSSGCCKKIDYNLFLPTVINLTELILVELYGLKVFGTEDSVQLENEKKIIHLLS